MRKEQIGAIGESIVQNLLGGTLSEDKYDMDKDLTLDDGTQVEIKTQNRWVKDNSFSLNTLHFNQLPKCVSVDRLIWVEYGANNYINIYEDTKREYTIKKAGYRDAAAFPIAGMTLLARLHLPEEAEQLRQLSGADTRWLRNL